MTDRASQELEVHVGPTLPPPAESPPRRRGSIGPHSLRGRIVAGILVIIPLAVTWFLIDFVYRKALAVGANLVLWVRKAVAIGFAGAGAESQPTASEWAKPIDLENPGWRDIAVAIGLVLLLLYFLGWLGTNVAGRRIINKAESLVERIPFVDTIYGAIKRMVHSLGGVGGAEGQAQRVVLIDFPMEGMKAIGFLTNFITDENTGQRYATVFVPTTPNPTSGYMEIVPVEKITHTDLTMEEALSMVLSGGATAPTAVRFSQFTGLAAPHVERAHPVPQASGVES